MKTYVFKLTLTSHSRCSSLGSRYAKTAESRACGYRRSTPCPPRGTGAGLRSASPCSPGRISGKAVLGCCLPPPFSSLRDGSLLLCLTLLSSCATRLQVVVTQSSARAGSCGGFVFSDSTYSFLHLLVTCCRIKLPPIYEKYDAVALTRESQVIDDSQQKRFRYSLFIGSHGITRNQDSDQLTIHSQ